MLFQVIIWFIGCKVDVPLQPLKPSEAAPGSVSIKTDSIPPVIDEFVLELSNPWIEFTPDYKAKESSQDLNYKFSILANNSIYGSFILSNIDSIAQDISFNIKNNSSNTFKLFEVKQVKTNGGKFYSDPIVPISSNVVLPKNKSILFMFQIKGNQIGAGNTTISIDNGKQKKNISIEVETLVPSETVKDLNAVNWSYLHLPMVKDRIEEVGKDLYEHHINTSVVSFHAIPSIESTDFSSIINYVSTIKDVKNILIHSYPKSNTKNASFMSESWKKLFAAWYTNMLNALNNAGYSVDNVYFYPYDEISLDKVPELEKVYTWAKDAIPNFKFYATIITEETANKVVPLIDLTQLIHQHNPKLIENQYPKKGELWLYDTFGPTYALSPYTYYRLMAWTAYYRDIKGIGFWNYADMAKKTDNPIDAIIDEDFNGSYSVIYTGEKQEIISSRRWEAFSLGIEDYRILQLYEKKYGREKTKAKVWEVISAKDNYNMAEKIRDEMINSL